ncbi:hypothetical protein N9484_01930 [Polaribacter sp.]|nr:hypothetical protein [Polaribacter sp.]MDB4181096.1 hypothetical protein [Polaribacter sp.]
MLHFSIENFGNYSFTLLVLNLFSITVDPVLSSYLVDYKFFNYNRYNFGILIITLFLGVLSYFLIDVLILNIPIVLFILFSLTYLVSASLKSYLNIKDRYYNYGIVDIVRQLCILATTVTYFYGLKYNNYLQLLELNYLISSIAMILLAILFLKKSEIEFSLQIQKLKNLLFNSKFLIFYTAIVPLITFIDSYFVESFLTQEDLGMYSFSIKIYSISLLLVVPVFTILNIKQIEIAKENNYLNFIRENFKKIGSLSLVILVLSILFNWVLVNSVYNIYRESFWITNILILGSFITYISLPFSFLIAYRKYKYLFGLGVLAILLNLSINYFFIAKYGMIIAALSTFISQFIINFGAAIFSYYLLKLNKYED